MVVTALVIAYAILAADLDAQIKLVSVFEDESIMAGSELTAQRGQNSQC